MHTIIDYNVDFDNHLYDYNNYINNHGTANHNSCFVLSDERRLVVLVERDSMHGILRFMWNANSQPHVLVCIGGRRLQLQVELLLFFTSHIKPT
jgi:hypothetical protein